jgi:transglutaminase-like putative cysteine protease
LCKLAVIGLFVLVLFLTSPTVVAKAEEAVIYTITDTYELTNTGTNSATKVWAKIYLYDNQSGWANQEIISEKIEVDGVQIYPDIVDTDDNRWVEITIEEGLSPDETKTIKVTQVLVVRPTRIEIDPGAVGTAIPPEVKNYTRAVDGLFESDADEILEFASGIVENETNPYYKVRRILDNVIKYLRYEIQDSEHGALWAYYSRVADCTEYSNLLIALARAAGIPAKAVVGMARIPLYAGGQSGTGPGSFGHEWVIVYLPNYGWVPLDAVWPLNKGSFAEIDYFHIVGAITSGEGILRDGRIRWPGPGTISRNWEYVVGAPTTIEGSISTTITPEVLVEPELDASQQIRGDGTLTLTLTVKNTGRQPISNVTASISVDQRYFEIITPPQDIDSLSGEDQEVLTL